MADGGSELQQSRKKLRVERAMIKNFRMQLIPLAQTPTVSNVRRLRCQYSSHTSTKIGDTPLGSARNRPAPQESPQNRHTSSWLDTTFGSSMGYSTLSRTPCSTQPGITNDRSIVGILDEPLISMSDRNSYPTFEALREVSEPYSEPYWLARSDRASSCTTQSDIGMFKRLIVGTCYLDNQFLSSLRRSHSSRLQPSELRATSGYLVLVLVETNESFGRDSIVTDLCRLNDIGCNLPGVLPKILRNSTAFHVQSTPSSEDLPKT